MERRQPVSSTHLPLTYNINNTIVQSKYTYQDIGDKNVKSKRVIYFNFDASQSL